MDGTWICRADASNRVGTGHVMRLIALAEELRRRGGQPVFVVNSGAQGAISILRERGFESISLASQSGGSDDLRMVTSLVRERGAAAIVIDGYVFSSDYYRVLGETGVCVVAVDDLARIEFAVDLVVNQNFAAENLNYRTRPDTRLLVGSRYAMLRPEFLAHCRRGANAGDAARPFRLLVCFGGSDPTHATARVLSRIPASPSIVISAIVGASYEDNGALQQAAEQACAKGHVVELARGVSDMSWPMSMADATVTAAGSMVWELSYMSCPTAAYVVAENQEGTAGSLVRADCVLGGTWIGRLDDDELTADLRRLICDAEARAVAARRFATLVDGKGVVRVVDEISARATAVSQREVA